MKVMCDICEKTFSAERSLKRHLKEVHKLPELPSEVTSQGGIIYNSRCLESQCNSVFKNNKDLINHLQNVHLMTFITESHFMNNMNEFERWKLSIEKNNFFYVLKSKKNTTIGEIIYYKCNRSKTSHNIKDPLKRKRLLKSQGSCKLDYSCTSYIKVTNEKEKILVEWQKNHYGHNMDIQHIRLQKNEKQKIVSKILNGVSNQRILESTRNNIGEQLKRVDLLTNEDLRNIKVSYKIDLLDGKRDSNDAFSVALWVEECKNQEDNPILFYKEQGKPHSIFKDEDFCLILMNTFQKNMAQKFPSIITVDSTHGLNGYDFEMTTVMVLDEYSHGFPIAEMFTNRKDTVAQIEFFSAIKNNIGSINCKYFMSDMAEVFFNAWVLVMGQPYPQHLFCSWHVDRAWQSNLNKIKNKEKRFEVYKILKVLQQETLEINFVSSLNNTLNFMCSNESTKLFGEYFKNTYSFNYKKWAYCFRKGSIINTNMHLESMHKVIKYFYLQRKTVKRLDKGINIVLKYVRDKCVERIIRLSKGEHTKQTRLLSQNHKEALQLCDQYIIIEEKIGYWRVVKNELVSYNIFQLLDENCCQQICLFCETCSHKYSCNCKFYLDKKIMCKHIHMIINSTKKKKEKRNDNEILVLEDLQILNKMKPKQNSDVNKIKELILKLDNLNFHELDEATIQKIHNHLCIINNLSNNFKSEGVIGPLKNKSRKRCIEPQLRFTSTKKKRVQTKLNFSRASSAETKDIQKNLLHIPESSFNLLENDHTYCLKNN